tara:strand:- start:1399 stop:2061 length:663 start_codon:yes stop_codon:yes gene_type:complete
MAIGGIVVNVNQVINIKNKLAGVKNTHNLNSELKWSKVSKAKLPAYKEYIDIFFNNTNHMSFHGLLVDTQKIDNKRFNGGDHEVGFQKMLFQLLFKFGKVHRDSLPIHCYLHQRSSTQPLKKLQDILNNSFKKKYESDQEPYEKINYIPLVASDILQLNDILLGALAAQKNGHHLKPKASPAKKELGSYILHKSDVSDLISDTPYDKIDFSIWNFQLKHG